MDNNRLPIAISVLFSEPQNSRGEGHKPHLPPPHLTAALSRFNVTGAHQQDSFLIFQKIICAENNVFWEISPLFNANCPCHLK